jgi:hypothetical protein
MRRRWRSRRHCAQCQQRGEQPLAGRRLRGLDPAASIMMPGGAAHGTGMAVTVYSGLHAGRALAAATDVPGTTSTRRVIRRGPPSAAGEPGRLGTHPGQLLGSPRRGGGAATRADVTVTALTEEAAPAWPAWPARGRNCLPVQGARSRNLTVPGPPGQARLPQAEVTVQVSSRRRPRRGCGTGIGSDHDAPTHCPVESEFPSGHKHRVPLLSGCCSAIARTRHNQGRNTAAQPLLGTLVPPISSHSPVEGS